MKNTIKIQLESGAEKDVPLDIITEYGMVCDIRELPPVAPYRDIFPKFVAGKKHCYIKIAPFNDTIYITKASIEKVYELMERKRNESSN